MQIFHWSIPANIYWKIKRMEYFRSLYQKLVEYDGNLLRSEVFDGDKLTIDDGAPAGQTGDEVCDYCRPH